MKHKLKEKAIEFRRQGYSYSEILKEISVAKSTLSLWLRSVNLSKRQKQRLTDKKIDAIKRGLESIKHKKIERIKSIIKDAKSKIKKIKIDKEKLFLMGVMLYWAEGAKQKIYFNESQGVVFSNSDPKMIKIFLNWLINCLEIAFLNIKFDIYIHDTYRNKSKEVSEYWSKITSFPEGKFDKIYYKKHKVITSRKNSGTNYHGLIRVKVSKSTDLNRKISAWIEEICNQCGVV